MSGDEQQLCVVPEQSGGGVTEHPGSGDTIVPIIEVAFLKNGQWWSIPQKMSAQLYTKHVQGEDASYIWDWGEGGRVGSWRPDGQGTGINRYVIDFVNLIQTNIGNKRKRSIRIVWVRPQDIVPQFTGQLPADEQ